MLNTMCPNVSTRYSKMCLPGIDFCAATEMYMCVFDQIRAYDVPKEYHRSYMRLKNVLMSTIETIKFTFNLISSYWYGKLTFQGSAHTDFAE